MNAGSLELSSQLAMLKAFRCRENMTRAGVNFVKNDIPLAFDSKQLTDGGKVFFFFGGDGTRRGFRVSTFARFGTGAGPRMLTERIIDLQPFFFLSFILIPDVRSESVMEEGAEFPVFFWRAG